MWEALLKAIGKSTDIAELNAIKKGILDAYHGSPSVYGHISHSRTGEIVGTINERIEHVQGSRHIIDAILDAIF
ncbi:hypothetical protein ACTHPF_26805 [Paenibacillus sp. SAF-054]|uniref:hypothetical protein n=1 Tax=unclassified Paenibacillus TaxID=185978 RepID=UPI003F7F33F2